jgi:hypothetical protein
MITAAEKQKLFGQLHRPFLRCAPQINLFFIFSLFLIYSASSLAAPCLVRNCAIEKTR